MYIAFKHLHLTTAILSLLLTLTWSVMAWRGRSLADGGFSGKLKTTYVIHRVTAGLAGFTGLAVTYIGPWQMMIFPYIGLAAFIVHGLAATASKRTFVSDRHGQRRVALLIQVAALVFSACIMNAKPL